MGGQSVRRQTGIEEEIEIMIEIDEINAQIWFWCEQYRKVKRDVMSEIIQLTLRCKEIDRQILELERQKSALLKG